MPLYLIQMQIMLKNGRVLRGMAVTAGWSEVIEIPYNIRGQNPGTFLP